MQQGHASLSISLLNEHIQLKNNPNLFAKKLHANGFSYGPDQVKYATSEKNICMEQKTEKHMT